MDNPKFTIYQSDANSQYYYRLRAANGEIVLNGEGYTTKQSCADGIASIKTNASADDRYERKEGAASYSFNLKAANGEVIGTSESYSSKQARETGIEAVKKDAPGAPVEDMS